MYLRWRSALIIILLLPLCYGACRRDTSAAVEAAFYYWKTVYRPDSTERASLRNISADRVYIRIMDIDNQGANGEAIPVSAVTFDEPLPDTLAAVPVVYIVNNVLKGQSAGQLETLAANISRFVSGKMKQAGKARFDEIQVDCDWTATTRDNYFALLEALRIHMGDSVQLTSTLRLHQVRNLRSSGIPPVDRVLLMCYNMGNLRQYGDHNSILDLQEMNTYLDGFLDDYPLPMDIALPLFSWPVIFRDQQYIGISKRLDTELLADTVLFDHNVGTRLYRLVGDLPEAGLRRGDVVRYEETQWDDLTAAAAFLAQHKRKEPFTLLFYHLDSQVLKDFTDEQLQEIIHRF